MFTFGQRLKALRKEAQLTQAELAEQLGVSVQALSKWECGSTMPGNCRMKKNSAKAVAMMTFAESLFRVAYRFAREIYSPSGLTLVYAGRMILPAFCISSIRCALQPAILATAKMGVNSS